MSDNKRKRKRKKSTFLRRSEKAKQKASKKMEKIARKMVRKQKDVGPIDEILAKARRENIGRLHVRRSRDAYHEALGLALKLMYAVSASVDQNGELTKLAEDRPFKVTAKTTPQLIVVRATLEYDATEKVRRAEERRASRDAAAVHHLFHRDIDPDDVVELGKKKGEGVEAWARAGSAAVPKSRAGQPSSPATDSAVVDDEAVAIKVALPKPSKPVANLRKCKLGYETSAHFRSVKLTTRKLLWSSAKAATKKAARQAVKNATKRATITVEVADASPDKMPNRTFKALVAAFDARFAQMAKELGVKVPTRGVSSNGRGA